MKRLGQILVDGFREFVRDLKGGREPDNAIVRNKTDLARLGREMRAIDEETIREQVRQKVDELFPD